VTESQLYSIAAAGIILLIGFPIHEFSHAFVADRLGDRTARYLGRLSLDPRRHFDPLGGIMLILTSVGFGIPLGWAKPTPVNPRNLAYGHRGEALVALGGPASNLVMAAVAAIGVRLVDLSAAAQTAIDQGGIARAVFGVLVFIVFINLILFVFNLVPIPPLDGWSVLKGLVSPQVAWQLRQVEQYGMIVLVLVFFFGGRIILPIADTLFALLTGRPGG
jgi:Zn-dependent protease